MDLLPRVELNWIIEPDDFIPYEIVWEEDGYFCKIHSSEAIALIDLSKIIASEKLVQAIESSIISELRSIQILFNRNFSISPMKRVEYSSEGKTTQYLQPTSIVAGIPAFGRPVLTQFDEEGNLIPNLDFKEKKRNQEKLAKSLKKFESDRTLVFLFTSIDLSYQFPERSLSHLYDIRDALQSVFKSTDETINRLGITKSDWDYLGKKCNVDPFFEGRHSGYTHKRLKHVPSEELDNVRKIALSMIEKYINYLEEQSK